MKGVLHIVSKLEEKVEAKNSATNKMLTAILAKMDSGHSEMIWRDPKNNLILNASCRGRRP